MLVNGIDVDKYIQTFDEEVIASVKQFLDVFGCCEELVGSINVSVERAIKERSKKARDRHAENEDAKKKPAQEGRNEPGKLSVVIGFCPKCNSPMRGTPMPGCETKKTGRVFYKECGACPYYSEIWKKRHRYKEIEGG